MKNFAFCFLLLTLCCRAYARTDSLTVVFWNLENFFMPGDPQASTYWTERRFREKCNGISKTILEIADSCGRIPDAVGFAETGDIRVLERLLYNTPLRKLDYRIIHYDSPDRRGIDCALLYRQSSLNLIHSEAHPLRDSAGNIVNTRDILECTFEGLSILVNHHPSKLGNGAEDMRNTAMQTMLHIADSLTGPGHSVLSMGDFNDTVWGPGKTGTIKYNGVWEKIDGGFFFGQMGYDEKVFSPPSLLETDKSHGGLKPKRTFIGPRYNGGISDHLPIIFTIFTSRTINNH